MTDEGDDGDPPESLMPLGKLLAAIRLRQIVMTHHEQAEHDRLFDQSQDETVLIIMRIRRKKALARLQRVTTLLRLALERSECRHAFLKEVDAAEEAAEEIEIQKVLQEDIAENETLIRELERMPTGADEW